MNKKKKILNCFIFFFSVLINHNIYSNKIFLISIPKAGTHLLMKCTELLTLKKPKLCSLTKLMNDNSWLKESEFFHSHLRYSKKIENMFKKNNIKALFIYRDPRDQIVSRAFWILKKSKNSYMCNYKEQCPLQLSQIIDVLIENISKCYSRYMPWVQSNITCPIKFENLVGPNGNGSLETQKKEIKKICTHIGINCNQKEDYCLKNLFGGTDTFRKGQIGNWKEHFNDKQKNRFKKIAGQLLIDLEYETDFNW